MKVFVSGCFDLLHSGHVAFFKEAAQYGDLYVGLGSDDTIQDLKGRQTIYSEHERLYMVRSIKYVKDAWINTGNGILDFKDDLKRFNPNRYVVNEDGHSPAKEDLCNTLGIEYIVLKRIPAAGLPKRSTTQIRSDVRSQLPYRLDLAGTWIDQPYISKLNSGWAITISLEPIIEYNERSGMSTSTRNAAKQLWPNQLPLEKPEKLAEILFRFENKPGNKIVSGAQDSIGICVPGLSRHFYNGEYWPDKIEKVYNEAILDWLEKHIYLASALCWNAILEKDLETFGKAFLASFNAQTKIFPNMINKEIEREINKHKDTAIAWKLSGAGGGGYLVLVSEKPIKNAMKVKIRRWII
jgi:cytidyltransferase-like protein